MKEKLAWRSIIRLIDGDKERARELAEQAAEAEWREGRLFVAIGEIIKAKGEIA